MGVCADQSSRRTPPAPVFPLLILLRSDSSVRPSDLSTVIATTAEESLLLDRSHPCSTDWIASEKPGAKAFICCHNKVDRYARKWEG